LRGAEKDSISSSGTGREDSGKNHAGNQQIDRVITICIKDKLRGVKTSINIIKRFVNEILASHYVGPAGLVVSKLRDRAEAPSDEEITSGGQ